LDIEIEPFKQPTVVAFTGQLSGLQAQAQKTLQAR